MYPFMYYFDPTYVLVIIGAIVCAIASARVNIAYSKYDKVRNRRGVTAEQVAEQILHNAGIYDVRIQHIRGNLTDNYNPSNKTLNLSDAVLGKTSVAAIGVAAHECGHAIQDQVNYGPLRLRAASVPLANIGSYLSWPILILGIILGSSRLAHIGVFVFLFVIAFELITLPVEFNASHRALTILRDDNLLEQDEVKMAKSVLVAAALTYVAALFSAFLQLLRMLIIAGGTSNRDD